MYYGVALVLILFLFTGCKVNNLSSDSFQLTELEYEEIKDNLIRFHVIANSDTEEDQNLKLKVRDAVIDGLSSKLESSTTVEEAKQILNDNIQYVNDIARQVIEINNYDYDVKTMLSHENFPDKVYGDYVFPQGDYEAFRVIIGDGNGQNWWCVMFPPLCFIDESKTAVDSTELEKNIESNKKNEELDNDNENIVFKSKIFEVIGKLFN